MAIHPFYFTVIAMQFTKTVIMAMEEIYSYYKSGYTVFKEVFF
jgi:hypothetical protein